LNLEEGQGKKERLKGEREKISEWQRAIWNQGGEPQRRRISRGESRVGSQKEDAEHEKKWKNYPLWRQRGNRKKAGGQELFPSGRRTQSFLTMKGVRLKWAVRDKKKGNLVVLRNCERGRKIRRETSTTSLRCCESNERNRRFCSALG